MRPLVVADGLRWLCRQLFGSESTSSSCGQVTSATSSGGPSRRAMTTKRPTSPIPQHCYTLSPPVNQLRQGNQGHRSNGRGIPARAKMGFLRGLTFSNGMLLGSKGSEAITQLMIPVLHLERRATESTGSERKAEFGKATITIVPSVDRRSDEITGQCGRDNA